MGDNFWHDAAKGGVIIGLVYIILSQIGIQLDLSQTGGMTYLMLVFLIFLVKCAALLTVEIVFTKRRRALAPEGFGYAQAFTFIAGMMLLGGFIYGVWFAVVESRLMLDTYIESQLAVVEKLLAITPEAGRYLPENYWDTVAAYKPSIVAVLFNKTLGMLLAGGFFGLFVSAGMRTKTNPFANMPPKQEDGDE